MRFRGALLAATVLAAPAAVKAQPFNGIYIGAGAGYNYLQDIDVRPSPALGTPGLKVRGNNGYVALGSVGYGFGNGLRIEVEGNYRDTQLRKVTGTVFPTTSGGPDPELRRDAQRAVRHGYRGSLALSLSRPRRRLWLDQSGQGLRRGHKFSLQPAQQ